MMRISLYYTLRSGGGPYEEDGRGGKCVDPILVPKKVKER
jgi:hypothetical protein